MKTSNEKGSVPKENESKGKCILHLIIKLNGYYSTVENLIELIRYFLE